jgi:excisionase family DNA binding protein
MERRFGLRRQTDQLAVTVDEAAHLISVSKSKMGDLLRKGGIPSIKVDGMRRVTVRALEDWLVHEEEKLCQGEVDLPIIGDVFGETARGPSRGSRMAAGRRR